MNDLIAVAQQVAEQQKGPPPHSHGRVRHVGAQVQQHATCRFLSPATWRGGAFVVRQFRFAEACLHVQQVRGEQR